MKFKSIILFLLPIAILAGSCKSNKCDAEKQAQTDEAAILKFLTDKNIQAQRHSSGLYYQIISTGTGNLTYSANTTVNARYIGRLLNGTVFDSSDNIPSKIFTFKLGGVIAGWQVGIPLIQKGGKIRLFIPSGMAYGCDGNQGIPPNTILDFDVELVDATN